MRHFVSNLLVFIFFSLALYPQECILIEGGATYTQDSSDFAVKNLVVDNLVWKYEPECQAFLLATGKVTAEIFAKSGTIGHSCFAEAQLLLMRGDTILACYHPPRVKGKDRVKISFEHTFEVGNSYASEGPLTGLKLKARVYVYADFQKNTRGDAIVNYTSESFRYNPYSSASSSN